MLGKDVSVIVTKDLRDGFESLLRFNCGNSNINELVVEDCRSKSTVSYFFIDEEKEQLIAYCSLACSGIMMDVDNESFREPRTIISALEIKYFAVDKEYRSLRMSEDSDKYDTLSAAIFRYCIKIAYDIANEHAGANELILYSVPPAESFYAHNGLVKFGEGMNKDADCFLKGCIPMRFGFPDRQHID